MVAIDEDALVCDFAEVYHVYNWRGLPVQYAAVLAFGLRDDSRIKMAMTGRKVTMETMLGASAVDALNLLVWMRTKDAQRNRNRPKSLLAALTGASGETRVMAFATAEEFEARKAAILKGA